MIQLNIFLEQRRCSGRFCVILRIRSATAARIWPQVGIVASSSSGLGELLAAGEAKPMRASQAATNYLRVHGPRSAVAPWSRDSSTFPSLLRQFLRAGRCLRGRR